MIKADGESGPELALFDLAVSVAAARMATAVHKGRVDPGDHALGLRRHRQDDRSGGGPAGGPRRPRARRRPRSPPAAVPALSPGPPDGRHLSRPGAEGRAAGRARAGEERPQGRARCRLGRGATTGGAAAHFRRSAGRRGDRRERPRPLQRARRRGGEALPAPPRPRCRRRDRRRHHQGGQRQPRRSHPPDRAVDGTDALAAER